jgi:hypothetical protein
MLLNSVHDKIYE